MGALSLKTASSQGTDGSRFISNTGQANHMAAANNPGRLICRDRESS
jgi:hypothetical protein